MKCRGGEEDEGEKLKNEMEEAQIKLFTIGNNHSKR